VLYSNDFGSIDADEVKDFAVAIFTYSHEVFEYLLTDFYEVGKAGDFEAPEDGFAVVIHKSQADYINRAKALDKKTPVFPHGVHLYTEADYEIDKAKTAPTIDGVFNKSEWKDYLIEKVDSSNHNWSYAQFETNNYYATDSENEAVSENATASENTNDDVAEEEGGLSTGVLIAIIVAGIVVVAAIVIIIVKSKKK
jgi:hypothetical protein